MPQIDQQFVTAENLPEQTGRPPDAAAEGAILHSAFTWVPRSLIPYPEPLIRSGTFYGTERGVTTTVQLIRETPDFLLLPRHLVTAALPRSARHVNLLDGLTWDVVHFEDRVQVRDAKQARAWTAFEAATCGIICVPCGAGKTVLSMKKIAQARVPALIFVNSEMLMEQWFDAARQFLGLAEEDLGVVRGPVAQWDRPFVVAMIQTVAPNADAVPLWARQRFGIVLYDEVHHLSAPLFSRVAGLFYGARYGLSATPNRQDQLEGVYFAHLGPIFYSDTETEVPADVYFRQLDTHKPPDRAIFLWDGSLSIAGLYRYLAEQPLRNERVARDVRDAVVAGRKVLVLSHSVEHVSILAAAIEALAGVPVGVVTGKVLGKDKGAKRLAILRDHQVVCATFNIAKEGLNVPEIDSVVFATPFKDWGAFTQAKGRCERAHPGKKPPMALLYEDVNISVCCALFRHIKRNLRDNGLNYRELPA